MALGATGTLPARVRAESAGLWLLCLWPAFTYIRRPAGVREPLPFLPLFGIVYGAYFAIPLALGLTNLGGFGSYLRAEDYAAAADAAMLGWLGLLAGTSVWRSGRTPSARKPVELDPAALMRWSIGLAWLSSTFALMQFSAFLPVVLSSAILFLRIIGWFGLSSGIMLVVRGYGRTWDRLLLTGAGVAQGVAILVSGALAEFIFIAIVVMFAVWTVRGRFKSREILMTCVFVVAVISLKAVIPDYRNEAWYSERQLSVTERIALMNTLVTGRIQEGGRGALLQEGRDRSTERSAAADLLADVIQRTPAEVPYWNGESYVSLVGALVPRLLWPDKPEKDLGQRFGHRYSYLSAGNIGTSINLPWLVEMYANFGMWFMAIGGAILGSILALLGRFLNRPGQSDLWTAAGIALLVPLYNIESDFSLIYGGLILYGVAIYIVVRGIERTCRVDVTASRPDGYALSGLLHPARR